MKTRRFVFGFAVLAAISAAAVPVLALAAEPPLSAEDKALVQKAADYLQNLKGAKGKFTQTDAKGQVSRGAVYIQRPGKARFQYDPPKALLVVADGENVSVYDQRLKSFDQYPLEQTPLILLLGKTVRLDRGVTVTAVGKTAEGFVIDARDAHKDSQGRILLDFAQNPVSLLGWTVVDAQGQKTEVKLSGFKETAALDPALFVLHDPTVGAKPH